MKYDIVEYKKWNGDDTENGPKFIYAITADRGKPIGLTLPESCESIEMGREFLASIGDAMFNVRNVGYLNDLFAEFLKQREEAGVAVEQSCNRLYQA